MDDRRPGLIRKLGVVLFIVALLATLLGIFHLIENWRGNKKWAAYKQKLIGQGKRVDLAAFVPPPIPDHDNFAATPFFAELFPGPKNTNWNIKHWPETFSRINPQTAAGKRNERTLTDLVAWQNALRGETNSVRDSGPDARAKAAAEIVAAMKPYEPALQELRAASQRPRSRYNIRYDMNNPWGILLPHLPVLKQVSQFLSLKASAELARGNSAAALEDVRLMMRLVDSAENELFLINYIVRVACFQIALQPIWEGLVLDRWSDAQLEELQGLMLRYNFINEVQTPLEAEQAAGVLTADLLLKHSELLGMLAYPEQPRPSSTSLNAAVLFLIPRGWYRMEQHEYVRLFQEFLLPGLDGTNRVISPKTINGNEQQLEKEFSARWQSLFRHRFLSALLMPAVVKTHSKAAHAQTAAHQAAIACALQRYRHKHGQYPNELAALVPEFMAKIPHDVIGGKPMGYKSGKSYVLYSVGWDEKDDSGTPGKVLWDDKGDWVWRYPQPL
jgi:hypothetical protein